MTKKTKKQEPQVSAAYKEQKLMELEDLTESWVELLEQSSATGMIFHILTKDGWVEEYVDLTHKEALDPRRVLIEFC